MSASSKLPLPIKALAALATIPTNVFCNYLANIMAGGWTVMQAVDSKTFVAAAAVAGLFGWIRLLTNRDEKEREQLARAIRAIKCDVGTASEFIEGIAKGRIEVSFTIDELMKSEIEDACQRIVAAPISGLSDQDATTILDALHRTAKREQLEAFETKFDDFCTEAMMLLWTQDHRGREQSAVLDRIDNTSFRTYRRTAGLVTKVDVVLEKLEENQRLRGEIDSLRSENERLKADARAAVESVADDAKAGDDLAEEAIESGDPAKVQAYLIRRTDAKGKQLATMQNRTQELTTEVVEGNRLIAAIAYLRGDIVEANKRLSSILRLLPDDLDALNRMGQISQLRGDFPEAERFYQRVLDLSCDDPTWQAIAYGNLGTVSLDRGDLDQAEARQHKALEIDQKHERLRGMAAEYGNLGLIAYLRDKLDVAWAMHQKSLKIHRQLDNPYGIASCLGNLGLVQLARKQYDSAREAFEKSLHIYEKLHHARGTSIQCGNLAIFHLRLGNDKLATVYFERHLRILKELGQTRQMARSYFQFGAIYKDRRDFIKTSEHWGEAQSLFFAIHDEEGLHIVMSASREVFLDRLERGDLPTVPAQNADPNPTVPDRDPHPVP